MPIENDKDKIKIKTDGIMMKWRTIAMLDYIKNQLENNDEAWRIIETIDNYKKFVKHLSETFEMKNTREEKRIKYDI